MLIESKPPRNSEDLVEAEKKSSKTAIETLAPIWTTVVRRASAAHRTTTMFGYIGQGRFGCEGGGSEAFFL
ncbi:hypothetical protein A2U01_0110196, partial [Trifolium medium]|nr:hypothetical protein [Trifolium medium]